MNKKRGNGFSNTSGVEHLIPCPRFRVTTCRGSVRWSPMKEVRLVWLQEKMMSCCMSWHHSACEGPYSQVNQQGLRW